MSEPHRLPVYVAPDLCGPCGASGRSCCENAPGSPNPEDFGAPDQDEMLARITAALATGRWSFDWWEAEPWRCHPEEALRHDVFFPRPAIRGEEGEELFPATLSGNDPCTFLTAAGCELEHDVRPLECRAMEPKPHGACIEHAGSRRERAIEWWPYRDVIARARAARRGQSASSALIRARVDDNC